MEEIREILNSKDIKRIRALFAFNSSDSHERVLLKFNLWARFFFAKYFSSKDAPFHEEIDLNNLKVYRGEITSFVNIAFRGASKTARTKLFVAFCILNDLEHYRKYFKVLSADADNSRQIVTDVYNMLVNYKIAKYYKEIFAETLAKREETMNSFTTSTGIKMTSGTVGTDQRGAIQEESRPDFLWYEDFESRTTLRSARKTKSIWENMEEARTGLAKNGSAVYTCNYISEQGNVHTLVTRETDSKVVLIVPIIDSKGVLAWSDRYSLSDIEQMRKEDEDFEGERLCLPSASKDVFFDREILDAMEIKFPIKESMGFRMYGKFNPSHRYASGHDISGGVGLDSSTSVFIDFSTIPAQVVGVFEDNTIKPDNFGDEIMREGDFFGNPLCAPEKNNHGHATIGRLKQLDANLYKTEGKQTKVFYISSTEYGWHTNAHTKPKMLFALAKAIEDGLLELNDEDLIKECKSYTRNDLIDNENDPRLVTRHHDLVIALAIAWQMKDKAPHTRKDNPLKNYLDSKDDGINPAI